MIFTLIRMHTGILWTDMEEGVSQKVTVQKNTAIISWDVRIIVLVCLMKFYWKVG